MPASPSPLGLRLLRPFVACAVTACAAAGPQPPRVVPPARSPLRVLQPTDWGRASSRGEVVGRALVAEGGALDADAPRRSQHADDSLVNYTCHLPARDFWGSPEDLRDATLSEDTIMRVLRAQHGGFVACYERMTRPRRRVAGTITLRVTVGPEGRATEATAEGYPEEPRVARCFEERVLRLAFPRAADGRPIAFGVPFRLSPGE